MNVDTINRIRDYRRQTGCSIAEAKRALSVGPNIYLIEAIENALSERGYAQIAVSKFVQRQTPESEFSHFTGTWEELRKSVQHCFEAGFYKPGYRDGVVLVQVPPGVPEHPGCFFSNIVQLKEGDKLVGEFKCRQPGEEPRKSVRVVGGRKMPAESVFVVLYRSDVLAENNERSSDADWEIISINASPFPADVEVPMSVGTLIANHFHFSGGTETHLTSDEFVQKLRQSAEFWKDKAIASGE